MRNKRIVLKCIFFALVLGFCPMFFGCFNHTHSMGDWYSISPATCNEAEVLERKCETCNHKETKSGKPKLEHDYKQSVINPTKNSNGYTLFRCDCGEEYKTNHTVLVTYKNFTQNSLIDVNLLPKIENEVLAKGSSFTGTYEFGLFVPTFYSINVGSKIENSIEVAINWDLKEELFRSQNENNLLEMLGRVQKLEEISKAYNKEKSSTNDSSIRVLQYIRNKRYNTSEWNSFGGTMETDFVDFVEANGVGLNLSSLQDLSTITIPATGEKVDFVHLMAVLNVVLKNEITSTINDLVGWGGDLLTLAIDVKNSSLSGTIEDRANALFMSSSSSFSSEDLFADLDAINLKRVYDNSNLKSVAGCLLAYYNQIRTNERKGLFVDNVFNKTFNENSQLANEIYSRLSNNLVVKLWCSKNGLSFSNDQETINACIGVFANYLLK